MSSPSAVNYALRDTSFMKARGACYRCRARVLCVAEWDAVQRSGMDAGRKMSEKCKKNQGCLSSYQLLKGRGEKGIIRAMRNKSMHINWVTVMSLYVHNSRAVVLLMSNQCLTYVSQISHVSPTYLHDSVVLLVDFWCLSSVSHKYLVCLTYMSSHFDIRVRMVLHVLTYICHASHT